MTSVSVVIPLHNDKETLRRAIDSAVGQTFLHEIIVVDDCSTDDSYDFALSLIAEYPLLKLIRASRNGGPAIARNLGAKSATGEFLCFLDADDEFLANYFSEIIPLFAKKPEMHAIKVGMVFFDPVKGYVLPDYDPRYTAVVFSSPCNVLIRRASFERMGGFSEDPAFRSRHGGEDVAFCRALAELMGPLGRVDKEYFRCWSYQGSHLDNFLATTRLADNADGFEFVGLDDARKPGGAIDLAVASYLDAVKARLSA